MEKTIKLIKLKDLPTENLRLPEGLHIYGEDEFLEVMNKEGKYWRKNSVKEGYFKSFDNKKIKYYYAIPQDLKKIVVMVHGFCEFWGKYHEMAEYLYRMGYGFFMLEQRGHGLSAREIDEIDVVHIDHFSDYVKDLKCFLDGVVLKKTIKEKLVLFAHSMGGAVAGLFLEEYPDYFKKAILSSPMFKLRTGGIPQIAIDLMAIYIRLSGQRKKLAFNQHKFDPTPIFEKSSTLSKARYDYLFMQRLEDDHYKTYGGTYAWEFESIKADRKLLRHLDKIKADVVIFQAGNDHLVDVEAYTDRAIKKIGSCSIIRYEESKHEVFNAYQEIIEDFYKRFFLELSK